MVSSLVSSAGANLENIAPGALGQQLVKGLEQLKHLLAKRKVHRGSAADDPVIEVTHPYGEVVGVSDIASTGLTAQAAGVEQRPHL